MDSRKMPMTLIDNAIHANDSDFLFCQRCGYRRKLVVPRVSSPMDPQKLLGIDERLKQLSLFSQATSYSKQ